jgi:Na+/H+-dicarboxylate symporter
MPKILLAVFVGLVIGLVVAAMFPDALANVLSTLGVGPSR